MLIKSVIEFPFVIHLFSIRFTYQRFEDSPLDQLEHQYAVDEDMNDDELGEEFKIEVPVTKPSPFSQKRVMFSGPEKVTLFRKTPP